MLVAIGENNQRILAKNASKKQMYVCPHCQSEVVFRRGEKVIPHFAHKVKGSRPCYKNETYEHYQTKILLAQKFEKLNHHVQIEPYYGGVYQYPDLVIDNKFAIEVQFSRISVNEIMKRTRGLESIGLSVYWLISDMVIKKNIMKLNQFQATFINPMSRTLFTWSIDKAELVIYRHLQNIGGKKFVAKSYTSNLTTLFDKGNHRHYKVYQLTRAKILNYIKQCRWKNSVLEPTLSAMYQLRMNDEKVCDRLGFIFENQIYIETHPIEWQLQYLLLRRDFKSYEACQLLMGKVKFRCFACYRYNKFTVLKNLVNEFEKMYFIKCLNVQK
ncbi:competence protein CoiA [Staphylococcus caprae]|uniref:competence protein CoiA n=1 Tax=Staphylococcus caprae TaxID=29380 RepID=UPI000E6A44CA|nr:competence protein CoiA family protein [Staphylococcus caprae]MBU5271431.1 transcription factor [Staphylococcus caprae]MDK6296931.1 competence protein CoiA family protein [Staphylococcus caprae]MDK7233281.1 competence protein CoiA family protein [Staphylococcus caprae]RIM33896.1 transcription factor [Staphylococcus caprae]